MTVPAPLHDDRWEDTIPRAGYSQPDADLVAHVMEMYDLSKPDAEDMVARYDSEQIQTLVNRRWGVAAGDWEGVA